MMTRQPVSARNEDARLNFPLNFRIFAAGWKLLFLHHDELKPEPSRDAAWNRGRYLVSGLGHCGACHTPRNSLGAEKRHRPFAGGDGRNWYSPALDASSPSPIPWSAEQVFNYLRHDFDPLHGQVAGPMAPVSHNLARVPEADVRAIAAYTASLNDTDAATQQRQTQTALAFARDREATLPIMRASTATTPRQPEPPDASAQSKEGAAIFAGACATCHHGGGEWPSTRPVPLGLSTTVHGPDARNLLHIVVDGIHPRPGESGKIMPGFAGALTDAQIVALAGYVRSRFSDKPAWTGMAEALQQIRRRPAVTEAP
jgi:mono/diheme cytochrome c family protein